MNIKKIKYLLDENRLTLTDFPRFSKRKESFESIISNEKLEKCRYIFDSSNYIFVVNFDYFENF